MITWFTDIPATVRYVSGILLIASVALAYALLLYQSYHVRD